jgi:hypothetical protein
MRKAAAVVAARKIEPLAKTARSGRHRAPTRPVEPLASLGCPEAFSAAEASRIEARRSGGHLRTDLEYRLELGVTIRVIEKVNLSYAHRGRLLWSELVYL